MLVSMQAGLQSRRRTPPAVLTYATWNPSDKGAAVTLTSGDLDAAKSSGVSFQLVRATIGQSSGKHYFEVNADNDASSEMMIGIAKATLSVSSYPGADADGWAYKVNGGLLYNAGSTASGTTYTTGNKVMVALDLGAGKLWFGKNGTWLSGGDPAAGTGQQFSSISGTLFPCAGLFGFGDSFTANFGATALTYTPPSGFNAGWYS